MKKIALFSLMVLLTPGFAFAGGFWDIRAKTGVHNTANEYFVVGGKYFECDDDAGDVGDHVFAIVDRSKNGQLNYTAKECRLESGGDLWDTRHIPWCDTKDKCKQQINFGGNAYQFCSKTDRTRTIEGVLFVDGGKKTNDVPSTIKTYVGCFMCALGYVKPDKNYTFRDGCTGQCSFTTEECIPQEMLDCYKAKERKEPANWTGYICNCGSVNGVSYTWKNKKCEKLGGQPTTEQCTFSDGSKLDYGKKVEINCSTAPNKDPFIQDARTGKTCYKSCHRKAGKLVGFYSIKECENNSFDLISYTKEEKSVYSPEIPGYRRCVKKTEPVDPVKQKTCKEKRNTPEGKACCDLEAAREAEWDGKKCNCLSKNAEFRIENGQGLCIEKIVEPEPQQNCTYYFSGTIDCGNGKKVKIETVKSVIIPCVKDVSNGTYVNDIETMFANDAEALVKIKDELCTGESGDGQSGQVVAPLPDRVTPDYIAAEATLKKFFADAEDKDNRSVWKNAEGKFNTTRLASDITAGVVLGTVGGVVTGVVIKKNQVKKGFEALHCTVGGQKVADWGDEFTVGLQR